MVNNANDIYFRCSSNGHLMADGDGVTAKQLELINEFESRPKLTDKQKDEYNRLIEKRDNPALPDGVIIHLVDIFASAKYGRREEITSKFLEKGHACEEDNITLLSRVNKLIYKKNNVRLTNEYVTGEPDLFIGEDITNATETIDTKTSWSLHTFLRSKHAKLKSIYYWQGVGYMWLTGALKHTVSYGLVNGTDTAINDEKRKLAWNYGPDADVYPEYVEKCKQIEINHIFDMDLFKSHYPFFQLHNDMSAWNYDIPKEERVHSFSFERKEADILKLKNRIIECRKYMNKNLFKIKDALPVLQD